MGVRRYWVSRFMFSCPGYANVYGSYASGSSFDLSKQISYFQPPFELDGEFALKGEPETAVKSNGCFLIAMPKAK